MTTCSGGSEYCPHRSFAQPSRSKKSDRNQKYVDDNSPESTYPYMKYPSWLHDESSRKQLARALAVTRLDLSRSLTRSPYSAQNDLSQSLRSFPPRGVDVSFCRHPIDESSLDRRVFTRPTSRHSTVLSSLDRRVVTRPTSRHSTDESSLDRRVVTRPTSRHSTDESSLDRRVSNLDKRFISGAPMMASSIMVSEMKPMRNGRSVILYMLEHLATSKRSIFTMEPTFKDGIARPTGVNP
ncbi:hypothetical protein F2Q68_00043182 [Brassica cretica]|uniref:Uncharacterized protein n=1 Tax=Brassica cretica TaxID=69181 RepID=A0A8S9LT32_BRACR|nr:hypothetical protein F2Q68_00043182 [Brassica cretica]